MPKEMELKPCPFCGRNELSAQDDCGGKVVWISCDHCGGMSGCSGSQSNEMYDTLDPLEVMGPKELAVKLWNMRSETKSLTVCHSEELDAVTPKSPPKSKAKSKRSGVSKS